MLDYLAAVPNFLIYLATSGALLIAFMAAYMLATPQQDLALIRKGNVCASLVFSGTLLGFALPLASAVAHSVNLTDLVLWSVVACVVQGIVSLVLRFVIHDLRTHVEEDCVSVGVMMAGMKIAAGLLNAAAMTY
jgi:putative membrane protein